MMNQQFNISYRNELAEVIAQFRDLNDLYNSNLTLTLDNFGWEIFDMRVCRTIIRHDYKKVKHLLEDIHRMKNSIIRVGCVKYRRGNRPSSSEFWAYKYLLNMYNDSEIKYFTNET